MAAQGDTSEALYVDFIEFIGTHLKVLTHLGLNNAKSSISIARNASIMNDKEEGRRRIQLQSLTPKITL